jgi:hypothetical protein
MSVPDIIDNSEYQLFDVLNEILETGKPADLASGFFNIGGYALGRDKLNSISKFRALPPVFTHRTMPGCVSSRTVMAAA